MLTLNETHKLPPAFSLGGIENLVITGFSPKKIIHWDLEKSG